MYFAAVSNPVGPVSPLVLPTVSVVATTNTARRRTVVGVAEVVIWKGE
jgi:hypothetical protein